MLRRSLVHRRARSVSALIAMTVSAGVATALLTLYADLDAKLHKEFRSFGANVVMTAAANASVRYPRMPLDACGVRLRAMMRWRQSLGMRSRRRIRGTPVVVAGTDFAAVKRLDLRGGRCDACGPMLRRRIRCALLGQRAAQFVGNEHSVGLTYSGRPVTLQGAGRIKTGGDEDRSDFIRAAGCVCTALDGRGVPECD